MSHPTGSAWIRNWLRAKFSLGHLDQGAVTLGASLSVINAADAASPLAT